MKERNNAHVFGIDIGKNIFHVVGVDASGQPIQKVRFRRENCCSSSKKQHQQ